MGVTMFVVGTVDSGLLCPGVLYACCSAGAEAEGGTPLLPGQQIAPAPRQRMSVSRCDLPAQQRGSHQQQSHGIDIFLCSIEFVCVSDKATALWSALVHRR